MDDARTRAAEIMLAALPAGIDKAAGLAGIEAGLKTYAQFIESGVVVVVHSGGKRISVDVSRAFTEKARELADIAAEARRLHETTTR